MRKFVINLDEDTDRLRSFRDANRHVDGIVRFRAFRGSELSRTALNAEGYISLDLAYKNGTLGCARSHIALWEQAVKLGEPHLILEDDALLARNFDSAFERLLNIDPGWELITWGYNFNSYVWGELLDGMSRFRLALNQDDLRDNIRKWETLELSPMLLRLKHQFGLCGYSISPKGAARLIELCLPLSNNPISFDGYNVKIENSFFDCSVNRGFPKINAYMCFPPLVITTQDKSLSSITRINNETNIERDPKSAT